MSRRLRALADACGRGYLDTDPVGIVRRFDDPEDREIVGLVARGLAYGRVASIRASLERFLAIVGSRPSQFVASFNQLNTECLVVGIYSDWTIHIMMVRYALGTTVSVDQFDREDWQQFERQNPGVYLALREVVQVGGQSAIRRVYDLPSINTSEGRDYWIRYLVGYGEDVYLFTGRATSQSSFSQLQSEMENTVASVQFAR